MPLNRLSKNHNCALGGARTATGISIGQRNFERRVRRCLQACFPSRGGFAPFTPRHMNPCLFFKRQRVSGMTPETSINRTQSRSQLIRFPLKTSQSEQEGRILRANRKCGMQISTSRFRIAMLTMKLSTPSVECGIIRLLGHLLGEPGNLVFDESVREYLWRRKKEKRPQKQPRGDTAISQH